MNLILSHGYPFPYPMDASEQEREEIDNASHGRYLTLGGVVAFEWVHTVTIEFDSLAAAQAAQAQTGWTWWDGSGLVLEAKVSSADGYEQPAIIAEDRAWCGFQLRAK